MNRFYYQTCNFIFNLEPPQSDVESDSVDEPKSDLEIYFVQT